MDIQPVWEIHSPHADIGHRILYYPAVSSTQDVSWAHVRRGAVHGHAVMAGTQSRGRGRGKHVWLDGQQKRSLLVSVVLKPTPYLASRISMLGSIAMLRCIRRITGVEPTLKWPNDLLYQGRKVAGILVETETITTGDITCVMGFGLNLNFDDTGDTEIKGTTASIFEMGGTVVNADRAVILLLQELQTIYIAAQSSDEDLREWASRVAVLGDQMQIRDGARTVTGMLVEIESNGFLSLRLSNGTIEKFLTGEIVSENRV